MAVVSWSLTNLENVKRFIGISISDTTHNVLLQRLIDSASSYVEKATDRLLVARDYDKDLIADKENTWYNGDGTAVLFLRQYPVNSVSAVEINGSALAAAGDTDYYGSTGYALFERQGRLYYANGFTTGIRNVRVSYNAGYAVNTPEREELRELCNALVALVHKSAVKGTLGFKSERIGLYAYTKGDLKGVDIFGVHGEDVIFRYKRKWGGQ